MQGDVDGQIEREVVKLRNAATRVKDDDTAEKGKHEESEGEREGFKKASDSEPEASSEGDAAPTRANVSTRRRT